MPKAYISNQLRIAIEKTAGQRCGYCLTPQTITGAPLEIDHIIPERAGGRTIESNLWLACTVCNRYKGSRTHGADPASAELEAFFNPREQQWRDHFAWRKDGGGDRRPYAVRPRHGGSFAHEQSRDRWRQIVMGAKRLVATRGLRTGTINRCARLRTNGHSTRQRCAVRQGGSGWPRCNEPGE